MTTETEEKPKNLLQEFKEFLKNYKVLGLTVAFIMAIYLGALVQALVNDLIMPIFELIPGATDVPWNQISFSIGNADFLIGHFLGELTTFIIIAFVIFLIVKLASRYDID
ncbi:MAG: large conductance mechanosensitive channel protein MscL [Candidatus Hodarchaeales archaeon]|jgi:large conductance mechanosensitive channel